MVSDVAGVPGGHDSGRAAARRAAAQLHGRDDGQRGEELRPGRDSHLDAVAPDGRAHGRSDQGGESECDHRDGRRASDRASRGDAETVGGDRYRSAQGIRLLDARGGAGPRLEHDRRNQLSEERRAASQSRPSGAHRRRARPAAVRDRGLREKPRLPEVQQPLLPVSVRVDVHRARMPGAMHVLPVAAGHAGPSLSHAQPGERLRRSGGDEGEVPEDEGTVLRRRHLHRRSGARAQDRAVAEAARHHVVDQLARQRRLRNAEDHEGRRACGCSWSATNRATRRF